MKLFLLKDVDKIGKKGDQVNVSKGYARNYLLARNLASMEKPIVKKITEKKIVSNNIIEKIINLKQPIRIDVEAATSGNLYAGIDKEKIRDSIMNQLGINIPTDFIVIEKPIKTVGNHNILIKDKNSLINTIDLIVNKK
ncbi:50S ribosomal protein L9 [Patescibacteria group bacterium]